MGKNDNLAGILSAQLEQNFSVVLASILNIQGSSPRHSGSKMVISSDGKNYGTIGGSLLEATAIRESRQALSLRQSLWLEFELNGKDANSSGMICGGKAEILLEYIPVTPEKKALFKTWLDLAGQGRDLFFLTHFRKGIKAVDILGHALLSSAGEVIGSSDLQRAELDLLKSELHNVSSSTVIPLENSQVAVDRVQKLKTLYLFGAGHVALPTARVADLVGFRVVVVDDRPDFASPERFPEASQILVVKDLKKAVEGLEIDSDSFLVIVTRGHQYDRAVLEGALKTKAGYIGMISSRRKREAIYEALMAQGVPKGELERVHSPIGIAIGGETPEEIAVSIVAELISERNKQKGAKL